MRMNFLTQITLKAIAILTAFTLSTAVFANPVIPVPIQTQQPSFIPSAPNLNAQGYILMDAASGKILAEKNADTRMSPASLTKLMSMYIISSALKNHSIRLEDPVRISTKAWKTEGSRMFVKVGDEVPVKELIQGIVVASGNDATVAMAEYIAGTEEAFISMMNNQAKLLGMNNSHFMDSTGLPHPNHYSTSHDLAILTQAYIKNFPEDYGLYSEKWFSYHGIRQPNRNRLLWRYQYADGLKTGHTNQAGYCLVASAKKDTMRLISVLMGAPNDQVRTEDSIRLLTYGFHFFETHKLYTAATALVKARVWEGTKSESALGLNNDLYVTIPINQYPHLQTATVLNTPLKAPIIKGQTYGTLSLTINNQIIMTTPLIALDDNPRGSLWRRAADSVKFNFHRIFSTSEEKVNTG